MPSTHPLLDLQSGVGNAAVTSLLRGAGAASLQRLSDGDDEDQEPTVEAPAEDTGPAEDAEAGEVDSGDSGQEPEGEITPEGGIDAVEAHVDAELDPAAVLAALAPYAASDEGPGDYEMPAGDTAQALFIQRDQPGEEAPATRPASPGDVLKALMPFLQPSLDRLKESVLKALSSLKTGEKVGAIIFAAPFVVAPLTQPGLRRFGLDQLDGTDVTFGVVPNLRITPSITDGQLRGGTATYDLAPLLRSAGIPF
jgi:hypothetical protein